MMSRGNSIPSEQTVLSGSRGSSIPSEQVAAKAAKKYIPKFFNQNVVIKGSDPVYYPWRPTANPASLTQSVTITCGLLIDIRDRLFILSARRDLAACTKFQVFYTMANCPLTPTLVPQDKSAVVFSQDLHIVFSSADFDIVLFASSGLDHFNPKLDKAFNPVEHTLSTFDLGKIKDHFVLPKVVDQTDQTDQIKGFSTIVVFDNVLTLEPGGSMSKATLKLFYLGSAVTKIMDSQPMIFLTFDIEKSTKPTPDILEGSPVYGTNGKFHGIIIKVHMQSNRVFVLPTKVLSKILYDFADYRIGPDSYKGIVDLPICYDIYEGKIIVSQKFKQTAEPTTHNPNPMPFVVGLYDEITKINGFALSTANGTVYVEDQLDYKVSLPLDLYVALYFGLGDSVDLTFDRNGIVYTLKVGCVPARQMAETLKRIQLTCQPYFHPTNYIPYEIDDEKIVYVRLSYELIRALQATSHDGIFIKPINFKQVDKNIRTIVQIDCLNTALAKSRNLHRLTKK
jgi:hypothetical protein